MQEDNIESRIKKAVQSIEDIERASPRPFFFTRLEARMSRESSPWMRMSTFFSRPAIAFASVCVILLFNLFVILGNKNSDATIVQQVNEYPAADEYAIVATSLYEVEN